MNIEVIIFLALIGYRHRSSGLGCPNSRHMHSTRAIAMGKYRLRYAESCKSSLPSNCNFVFITRSYCSFRVAATPRLSWKYGDYIGRLYDHSKNRQHCVHICGV